MQTTANGTTATSATAAAQVGKTGFGVVSVISFAYFPNDMMQSLIPATYSLLKGNFHLDLSQIGLIILIYQIMASLLQPVARLCTDRRPKLYLLAMSMGSTLVGLVFLSMTPNFGTVLLAAALASTGSSIFHLESSCAARMTSGGHHGLAQSLFQAGGNAGSVMGPLLAAIILMPYGQYSLAWFSIAALIAIFVLYHVGGWYERERAAGHDSKAGGRAYAAIELSSGQVAFAMTLLVVLLFSRYFYLASLSGYHTFFLITKFHLSAQTSQLFLFFFLLPVAVGMIAGSPTGDRAGRKVVIWVPILGVASFTLLLPYASLFWTAVLTVITGLMLASAFSAILVYAQELIPGKVGMVSGSLFGLAFGLGGIGVAVLGKLTDVTDIYNVYHLCSFLPLIGLLTVFLPNIEHER